MNPPYLELPTPSGSFGIGSTRRHVVNHENRPLPLRIWYPAREPGRAPLCSFLEPAEIQAVQKHILRNVPAIFLNQIVPHSHQDAVPIPSRFPVLFYVHGLGGLPGTNQALIENVVSHGYIVIALSHPGDSLVTLFPDGSVVHRVKEPAMKLVAQTAWLDQLAQKWAEDVIAAIDYCQRQPDSKDPVYASCDFERRGILGYSFGGAVARILCSHDKEMRLGINIDGTYYGTSPDATLSCNFMAMESDLSMYGTAPEELKLHNHRRTISWNSISGEAIRTTVSGARHTTFSDFTLASENFSQELDSAIGYRRCSALVNAHVIAFVQGCFRQSSPGCSLLPLAADYPEAIRS